MSIYAAIHGNEFTWNGLTYKVIVKDYGDGKKLAWLDRNLGASQVATAPLDTAAYGDLYQWGRDTDGHEKRTSGTTETLSSTDTPGHGDFILTADISPPRDWRVTPNNTLWQGVNGTNNPAPPGWRIPTETEFELERLSWSSNNAAGAFASSLKLPQAAGRNTNGVISDEGDAAVYHTSTVAGAYRRHIYFNSSIADWQSGYRGTGSIVRLVATPEFIDTFLRINDLDISEQPRLIFSANDLRKKGRSNKSFTIVIPNNRKNNIKLNNLFGQKLLKTITYEAKYTIDNVEMTGHLLINEMDAWRANALFISGNGSLWDKMEGALLNSTKAAWDDWNVTLDIDTVNITTEGNRVLFDVTDRGAFLENGKIDITERYPALNINEMLTTIFNALGVGIVSNNIPDSLYLLYTQTKDINNSNEWLKEALYKATLDSDTASLDGEGTGAIAWDEKLELLDTNTGGFDNDGNYSNVPNYEFRAPETGVYAFIATATLSYQLDAAGGGTAVFSDNEADVSLVIKKNGTAIRKVTQTVAAVAAITPITITANTQPIEVAENDLISVHSLLEGTITSFTMGTETAFTQGIDDAEVYNTTSRWYGAGSNVQMIDILPRMSTKEFISKLFTYLNVAVFYDIRQEQVTLLAGTPVLLQEPPIISGIDEAYTAHLNRVTAADGEGVIEANVKALLELICTNDVIDNSAYKELTVWDYIERLEVETNTELAQPQDKSLTPANTIITINKDLQTEQKQLDFAKTPMLYIERLAGVQDTFPVLWKDLNPLRTALANIPEAETEGALRVVEYVDKTDSLVDIVQTYGGDAADNDENRKLSWKFTDYDIQSLHEFDARVERVEIEFTAKANIEDLYNLSLFRGSVSLVDRRTGEKIRDVLLASAEQIDGDVFKFTAYSTIRIY